MIWVFKGLVASPYNAVGVLFNDILYFYLVFKEKPCQFASHISPKHLSWKMDTNYSGLRET